MGDVHEGGLDLGLDPLQLDLHLPAQLEVEGAERLVEQEHPGWLISARAERDPLLLPTGQLGRLAVGELGELDQLEHLVDLALDVLDARRRSPNATLS